MKHLKIVVEASNKSNKDFDDFTDGLGQGHRQLRASLCWSNLTHKWWHSEVQNNVKIDDILNFFKYWGLDGEGAGSDTSNLT